MKKRFKISPFRSFCRPSWCIRSTHTHIYLHVYHLPARRCVIVGRVSSWFAFSSPTASAACTGPRRCRETMPPFALSRCTGTCSRITPALRKCHPAVCLWLKGVRWSRHHVTEKAWPASTACPPGFEPCKYIYTYIPRLFGRRCEDTNDNPKLTRGYAKRPPPPPSPPMPGW